MSAGASMGAGDAPISVRFVTTHWSVVLDAADVDSPHRRESLERLCSTYWYPLYAFIRRRGHTPEDAQDLTQAFFARLLQKDYLSDVKQERGRFRSFLLAALRHFLANEWDRTRAAKRGGGQLLIPIDEAAAENRFALDLSHDLTAERIYERSWAATVIDQVRSRLRQEYLANGQSERFAVLEQLLPGAAGAVRQADAAEQLGMSLSALKSEVHRLKRRHGELLRAEIAHTVVRSEDIDEEIRYLIQIVSA
ncbi:MAG: RNA polymerase sigma factor [Verrucomicrobiia bacterium]